MDILNENYECDSIYNGHDEHIFGANGGRINDSFVSCGGKLGLHQNNVTNLEKCYILGQKSPIKYLVLPYLRNRDGVILPNNTLFLTGGSYSDNQV